MKVDQIGHYYFFAHPFKDNIDLYWYGIDENIFRSACEIRHASVLIIYGTLYLSKVDDVWTFITLETCFKSSWEKVSYKWVKFVDNASKYNAA